ncbi:unnamed protein product [Cunninghamella blakesleeana]
MSTEQKEPELTDEQILEFEQKIKDEEAEKIPLVCQNEPISKLEEEFKDNESFLKKIKNLSKNHSKIRRCRGDGNCFFRAFAFAWFESLLHNEEKYKASLEWLKSTPNLLESVGFQSLAYDDFYEMTLEQFNKIPIYANDPDLLLVTFQTPEISNAIVMHLRFVASAYLRFNANEYEPFLMVEMISIDEFCATHVEAFGKESDHLHIIALTKALVIPVEIIYLDGSESDQAAVHEFWPSEENKTDYPLKLIYRPGHYDILY